MASGAAPEWPLTGRAHELERLSALVRPGRPGLVMVGAPGVGKTRMLHELARRTRRHTTITATRTVAGIPLGAFAPVLPSRPQADGASVEVGLLRWAADAVTAACPPPGLVAVDDGHTLDAASAGVLPMLVAAGLTLAVTVRANEQVPDAVTALWKDLGLRRVDLEPLDAAAVVDLVTSVLGGPVEGSTRQALWSASAGNPLYLRELILGALDSGLLGTDAGLWRLRRPLATSPALHDLIEARLADVVGDDRAALEVLAVGEPLPVDLLTALVAPAAVERLERRGHAAVADGNARLAHPLHGEVVRHRLPGVRRMAISRRLADAVDAGAPPPDPLRLARWRLDGGATVDPQTLVVAAKAAFAAHDTELADRLAHAAVDAGGGVPARLVRAQVLGELHRAEEQAALFPRLLADAADEEERATVTMAWAETLFWGLGQPKRADDVLAAVGATLRPDGWRPEIAVHRATFALLAADIRTALEASAPWIGAEHRPIARVNAAMVTVLALALQGRPTAAVAVADRTIAEVAPVRQEVVGTDPALVSVARVVALTEQGRIHQAVADGVRGYERAVAEGSVFVQGWYAVSLGRVFLIAGEAESAERWFREAAAVYAVIGPGTDPQRRWAAAGRTIVAALRRDRAACAAHAAALAPEWPSTVAMFEPEVLRARAWASWLAGDNPTAATLLGVALILANRSGSTALAAAALHDGVRLGLLPGVTAAPALARLATEGGLGALRAAHVRALVEGNSTALLEVSDAYEATGLVLLAAEAAASATGLLRRAGDRNRADAAARRARDRADRCEGAVPIGIDLVGDGALLTGREREVAELAATGLPSRTIAERLDISPRTVDNLLARAYQKLGITSRRDLPGALDPFGLDA